MLGFTPRSVQSELTTFPQCHLLAMGTLVANRGKDISGMEPAWGVQGRDLRLWFASDSPRPHLKPTASALTGIDLMGVKWPLIALLTCDVEQHVISLLVT